MIHYTTEIVIPILLPFLFLLAVTVAATFAKRSAKSRMNALNDPTSSNITKHFLGLYNLKMDLNILKQLYRCGRNSSPMEPESSLYSEV